MTTASTQAKWVYPSLLPSAYRPWKKAQDEHGTTSPSALAFYGGAVIARSIIFGHKAGRAQAPWVCKGEECMKGRQRNDWIEVEAARTRWRFGNTPTLWSALSDSNMRQHRPPALCIATAGDILYIRNDGDRTGSLLSGK